MDANKHERLSNFTLIHKLKEQRFYCRSIFLSRSNIVKNEHDVHPTIERLSHFTQIKVKEKLHSTVGFFNARSLKQQMGMPLH